MTAVAEFDPDKIKTESFRDNPRLARVRRYCEDNPTARISLVDAARVANLEASYFSSFFHEKTGVCFHSWLNYTRVLRAMHLLADTDLSITNVSRKVGFRDLRTFQRAFKRFASVTPTEYRKQARAEQAERDARVPVNAGHRLVATHANGNGNGHVNHGNGNGHYGVIGNGNGNGHSNGNGHAERRSSDQQGGGSSERASDDARLQQRDDSA
ncbi:MAG: AraC family transcriptional regulator [Pseudomonadota bacterium]